jgi:hypothetical protein
VGFEIQGEQSSEISGDEDGRAKLVDSDKCVLNEERRAAREEKRKTLKMLNFLVHPDFPAEFSVWKIG